MSRARTNPAALQLYLIHDDIRTVGETPNSQFYPVLTRRKNMSVASAGRRLLQRRDDETIIIALLLMVMVLVVLNQ